MTLRPGVPLLMSAAMASVVSCTHVPGGLSADGGAVPPSGKLTAVAAPQAAPPAQPAPKYTYVLVHGAWAGGFEWKPVGERLAANGHTVYRVTLTGQGERMHLSNPDIDLETHINDVVNTLLFENLREVVLMGHSYGGMVITGVSDRVPERLKCLVYVDAFVPDDGESLNSIPRGGRGGTAAGRGGAAGAQPASGFQGTAPRAGQQPPYNVPQSVKTFNQPVSLKNPAARRIPVNYILTVEAGQQPQQDGFYWAYQRAQGRGWFTQIMEGSHVVMTTRPAETARLLELAPAQARASE